MPSRASWSARSFMAWPAWPFTQCQCTSWRLSAASSRCHRSTFLTGFLSAVRQPFFFQPWIQLGDAVRARIRCRCEIDAARPLQRLQRRDRRHQFHAVVGGVRLAAVEFLLAGRRSAGSRPSRPARDCPSRRRRCRSRRASLIRPRGRSRAALVHRLVEAQLAEIFERVLRPHQRAGRHGQPVVRAASAGSAAPRRAPASAAPRISAADERAHARVGRAAARAPW